MGRAASSNYVEKRDNSIRISFTYKGQPYRETVRLDGKVLPPTAANLRFAARLARDVRAEIDAEAAGLGKFDFVKHFPDSPRAAEFAALAPAVDESFGTLAELWRASKGKLVESTKDQYGSAVRFWIRMFGRDTPVPSLTHKVVEARVGGYPWRSPKQHNNYMIALRGIFEMEYRGARAGENPAAGIKNLKVIRKLPDPLTREERDRILADMRERYDERVYAYFLWQFYTGMRPEEAIALRWSDIDFAAGVARVRRVRTFKGMERDGSKTNAERDVDLVPQAIGALQVMKAYTFMQRVVRGRGDEDDACDIFQNPVTRRPWHDERSQRDHYWKPSLKRLGIRYRRSYCTRHTYCTVALMGNGRFGAPPAYIAAQAGHSIKMLLEVYARWIPGADGGAARDMLSQIMSGDFSLQSPQKEINDAKPLIPKGETGRRDWTRTKKKGG